jgi:aryl sulfotransferase
MAAAASRAAKELSRRHELAMELMTLRNKLMHPAESVRLGRSFIPRASDVFIVTYPKCGTTWMTQIVHQIRSSCSMDFGEITEECPWDVMAQVCDQDLDAPQTPHPFRVFKSHESYSDVAKAAAGSSPAKYIYVARNPLDAFLSFYKFLPAYQGLREGDIDIEHFCDAIFGGASLAGGIWTHFEGWWKQREDPNVLWIFFEDMKEDLPAVVRAVANFVDAPDYATDASKTQRVAAHASFSFMSAEANKNHFDDHFCYEKSRAIRGVPDGTSFTVGKVRSGGGKAGGGPAAIPPAIISRLEARWQTTLAPVTGLASYAELRAALTPLGRTVERSTPEELDAAKAAGVAAAAAAKAAAEM